MDLQMKNKILYTLALTIISLPVFAEPMTLESLRQNIHERDHLKFRARAKETYYSRFDSHNGIRNSDADLEFDVFGVNVVLKGYSQERADPFFYKELINPANNF
jgi:hypothetical protein